MSTAKHARPKDGNAEKLISTGALALGGLIPLVNAPAADAATTMTPEQVAKVAKEGCPQLTPERLNIAVKVAGAESGLNPGINAIGPEDSRGLWQINAGVHGSPWGNLYDPVTNAKAMCDLSKGGTNWLPWSAYTNGSYLNEPGWTGPVANYPPKRVVPQPAEKSDPGTGVSDEYTVRPGDTLFGIAQVKYGNGYRWPTIHEANKTKITDPDLIYPGQRLSIPEQRQNHKAAPQAQPQKPKPSQGYVSPLAAGTYRIGDNLIVGAGGSMSRTAGGHSGLDLSAPAGTPVRAVADGEVVVSSFGGGAGAAYGNHVVIRHADGKYTLYAHLATRSVWSGRVKAGQQIGTVGSTGTSSGPHLHFEVRATATGFSGFSNPLTYLKEHGVTL